MSRLEAAYELDLASTELASAIDAFSRGACELSEVTRRRAHRDATFKAWREAQ